MPNNLETLSEYLGFAPQHLFYLIEIADDLYFEFEIKKANGGVRKIAAPRTELKGVQKAILRKILEKEACDENCYAYVRGRNVVQAAHRLSGHRATLHLDIQDFFPTVTQKRVFGLFRSLHFNSAVSFMLARLCTQKGILCQGAPTSPYLSNLIFRRADRQLSSLAETFKIQYLRYSDDIFFFADRNFRYSRVAAVVEKVVNENGFVLNAKKTKYHRRNSPRFTLGLQTVAKKPQFSRQQRKGYRSAFYKASSNLKWGAQNISKLSGMAEWYRAVYGSDEKYQDFMRIISNVRNIKIHDAYVHS